MEKRGASPAFLLGVMTGLNPPKDSELATAASFRMKIIVPMMSMVKIENRIDARNNFQGLIVTTHLAVRELHKRLHSQVGYQFINFGASANLVNFSFIYYSKQLSS